MDLKLKGHTALVTGGGSGIGMATATLLAKEGANILINGLPSDDLKGAASKLDSHSNGGTVKWVAADLSKTEGVTHLYDQAKALFGHVDVIAHCAGIHGANGDFFELTDDDWLNTIQTDLMGAVRICRSFIPDMRDRGWGRIVLIASENAVQPYVGDDAYNVCKAGIINLTKGLSKAYSPDGVMINVVSPAFIATPMTDEMMDKIASERPKKSPLSSHFYAANQRVMSRAVIIVWTVVPCKRPFNLRQFTNGQ